MRRVRRPFPRSTRGTYDPKAPAGQRVHLPYLPGVGTPITRYNLSLLRLSLADRGRDLSDLTSTQVADMMTRPAFPVAQEWQPDPRHVARVAKLMRPKSA